MLVSLHFLFTGSSVELPILSNLVVQDHYSVPADGHYPTFILRRQVRAIILMQNRPFTIMM